MISLQAIVPKQDDAAVLEQFRRNMDRAQKGVYRAVAQHIADLSVQTEDTGTYAESHRVEANVDAVVPFKSSEGKRGGGTGGRASKRGLQQMEADIKRIPHGTTNVLFGNEALHAIYVEKRGWKKTPAYRIYAQTRRESGRIIHEVASSLSLLPKGKSR